MRLEEHLHPGRVVVGLRVRSREDALGALAGALADGGVAIPVERLAAALSAREAEHSTVLGRGLAVPHAVLPDLSETVLLVAVTAEPVDFGSPGEDPVRTFFTLLSPPGHEGTHIRLLARICRLARHDAFLGELVEAPSGAAALEILLQADRAEG